MNSMIAKTTKTNFHFTNTQIDTAVGHILFMKYVVVEVGTNVTDGKIYPPKFNTL